MAKRSPETLKPFRNTVLGLGWDHREGDALDEHALQKQATAFSLESMPEDVRIVVAGVDVQAWGFEVLSVGFDDDNRIYILDYRTLHGDPHGDEVWKDLDSFIKQRHAHPLGANMGYDAVSVDSGDGNLTERVYSFTRPRFGRRVIATKGHDGNRKLIDKSSKPGLFILGTDTGKARIFDLLEHEGRIRFSDSLPPRFYEELTSENRVTRYKDGRPKISFLPTLGVRNEALDCLVMALGVRTLVGVDFTHRSNELRGVAPPPKPMQPAYRFKIMGDR